MSIEMAWVAGLVFALAWANGANDIAKGIATLVGDGTVGAKRAVWWGTLCTALGGLTAALWGAELLQTFSSGFLQPGFPIGLDFIGSVLIGACAWVVFATRVGLPVSTTHALLGGVVGAGLVAAGTTGLRLDAVLHKALLPLLVSPLIAVVLCAVLLLVVRWLTRQVERWVPAWRPGCCAREAWQQNPFVCATATSGTASRAASPWRARAWVNLHWLSSGLTSFARGLNDVPKIAAFLLLVIAIDPAHLKMGNAHQIVWPMFAVTVVMAFGSLWGGFRVLDVLSQRIATLDSSTGVVANLGTSILVLAASPLGLPVSTTHVSTGALLGIRWAGKQPPGHADALKTVLYGWLITLPIAALIAALALRLSVALH
ncbi:MAG: inorganic phosphate transporter [Gammaproteobacteria bacterium]|nr:inorganic phosphate transporter [Gammaproteobacteria bacterium]